MTAAERAYAKAVKEIKRARRAGEVRLDLSGGAFAALDRLPDEFADWGGLYAVNLDNTQIVDLSPLAGKARLELLSLVRTQVSDISPLEDLGFLDLSFTHLVDFAPLAKLVNLRALYLRKTRIVDLAPLAGLLKLRSLDLDGTQVRDLRPICSIPFQDSAFAPDLTYRGIPATRLDPKLAELALIEDGKDRTHKTLAYLRSLPPYPVPLPWLVEDNEAVNSLTPPRAREEPPVTRGQAKVKTSAAQVRLLLREPQVTRVTAQGIAAQIRAAMVDVQPVSGNELPPALRSILEIADSLDSLGQTVLSPIEQKREAELRLRIAHLEAVVQRLTQDLKDSNAARDAAQALANKDDAWRSYKKTLAVGAGVSTTFFVTAGVYAGLSTLLGNSHPYVLALREGFAILNK